MVDFQPHGFDFSVIRAKHHTQAPAKVTCLHALACASGYCEIMNKPGWKI
jgi:hypothetical protein